MGPSLEPSTFPSSGPTSCEDEKYEDSSNTMVTYECQSLGNDGFSTPGARYDCTYSDLNTLCNISVCNDPDGDLPLPSEHCCSCHASPSNVPSDIPSDIPSKMPSNVPSMIPSKMPSKMPSNVPSMIPSKMPSNGPSVTP